MKKTRFLSRLAAALSVMIPILYCVCMAAADTQAPTVPEKLCAANITYTSIALSWSPSHDNIKVKGYQIYRDGKKISSTTKEAYMNTNLIPGRKYTYSVRAYDAAGNLSNSSNPIYVTTIADVQNPTKPENLAAAAAGFTSMTLTWSSSSDNTSVKGYEVYCDSKKKGSTAAAHYVVNSLSPGTKYSFYVKAYDIAGNYSIQSSSVSADTTVDGTTPSVPSGLKLSSVSETEASLTWSPSSDNVKIKRYDVFCDGKKVGTPTKTAYTLKNLVPGNSYSISIKAVDTSLNSSASSSPVKVTTLKDTQPPSKPGSLKLKSVKGSSAALEWTASTDNVKVKGYQIFCNGIMIESSVRTSRTVKLLFSPGINIIYIKAVDQSGNLSAPSSTLTVICTN